MVLAKKKKRKRGFLSVGGSVLRVQREKSNALLHLLLVKVRTVTGKYCFEISWW